MLRSIFWKPYSRLLIVGDSAGWSIDEDAKALKHMAEKLGIKAHIVKRVLFNIPQVVYYTSQFSLIYSPYKSKWRISVDYYHGKPNQQESFRKCYEALSKHHSQIDHVRVSTREMEGVIRNTGIDPRKIVRIPIAIDTEIFTPQTDTKRKEVRERLGIPSDAIVVGSFQKDGVGKGEGNEPKLIKGPDIFLEVIKRLKEDMPNLWVLLSGPSRGYVKNGLDQLGVPYRHEYLKDFRELTHLYDALDLYIITSREEGGPKAVLESMAKGVPLVTTEVGQAKDLVTNGVNAIMTPIDDVEGLYRGAFEALSQRERLIKNGLSTAEENSLSNQEPLWSGYFEGLLNNRL